MWGLVVVLFAFVLYGNAQNDLMDNFERLGCDKIELSKEEQVCYMNFMSDMLKSYGALANSLGSLEGDSNVTIYVNALKGVFENACNNDVCLNGIKKSFAACKV